MLYWYYHLILECYSIQMTHHIHVHPALGMELGSYDAGFKLMMINYIEKTNNCLLCRSKHTKV